MEDEMDIDGSVSERGSEMRGDHVTTPPAPYTAPLLFVNYPTIYRNMHSPYPAPYPPPPYPPPYPPSYQPSYLSVHVNPPNWPPGVSNPSKAADIPETEVDRTLASETSLAPNTNEDVSRESMRSSAELPVTLPHEPSVPSASNPQLSTWSSPHQSREFGDDYSSTSANSRGEWEPSAPAMIDYHSENYQGYGGERWNQAEGRRNMPFHNHSTPWYSTYQPHVALATSDPSLQSAAEVNTSRDSSSEVDLTPVAFLRPDENSHPADGTGRRSPAEAQTSHTQQQKSSDVPGFVSASSSESREKSSTGEQVNMAHQANLENSDNSPYTESNSSHQSGSSRNIEDRTFLTSQTGAKLFHVMDIRSDRQELSYVEKIILPRGQIVSFCQALNIESTKESAEGELSLSFETLDTSSLNVVGFYGSKELLTETLISCSAIASDDEVHAKMRGDSLFPGLYALLHGSTLIVFYWHLGPVLPQASRRDITCNFVRYLVDLCDSVFILLEGTGSFVREALNRGSIAKTVRQVRTRKMKIEKLQATENKVEILGGFSIRLNNGGSLPSKKQSHDEMPTRLWICEGSRCGLLSSRISPPRTKWRPDKKYVKLQDISPGTRLFDRKSVDFSSRDLTDQDLSVFLQCSGCPAGEQYVRHLEYSEKKKNDLKAAQKNEADREQLLKEYECDVEKTVTKFISEYLRIAQKFSWEEAMRCSLPIEELQALLLTSEEVVQKETPSSNPQGFFTALTQSFSSIVAPKSRDSRTDSRLKLGHSSLKKLESYIFTGFGRFEKVHHRFLFRGNTVRVTVRRRGFKDSSTQTYTVDVDNVHGGSRKPNGSGPICHRDRIALRAGKSRHSQSKEITLSVKDGLYDAAVITNTPLSGTTWDLPGEYLLDVVDDEFALGGLEEWVASEADRILPQLAKKANLLSYVLSSADERFLYETEIQRLLELENDGFIEGVVRKAPREATSDIRARWTEICAGASKDTPLLEKVVAQCSAVYETARNELFNTFQLRFKKNMKRLIETWIKNEEDERWKSLEDELREGKRRILNSLRGDCTATSAVRLRSCYIVDNPGSYSNSGYHRPQDPSNVWKLLGKAAQSKLALVYDEEISETETEKWLIEELSSSKYDLERLEMDQNHTFTPTHQAPRHILSLDPSTERLLKLAFLKTGQFLAFILSTKGEMNQCLVYVIAQAPMLLTTWNHGFDLIAFDDQTRFLALYDESKLMIKTYRFEEGYKHLEYSGAEVFLPELGVTSVTWMKFIPGRAEVVFVDSDHNVRVFEMAATGMVRAKEIQLPGPFAGAEVTRQGPCLLVFNEPTTTDLVKRAADMTTTLQMEVYWIDESMSHVSTIPVLSFNWRNLPNLHFEVAVRSFGPQEQLLLYIQDDQKLVSQALKITSASEEYKMFSDAASRVGGLQQRSSGLALDYLYHVYEKFSTNPPLAKQSRALSFYIVVNEHDLKTECLNYVDSCFKKLQTEKGKNFHGLDKQWFVQQSSEVSRVLAEIAHNDRTSGKRGLCRRSMGDWLRELLCMVPIQIARAENNCLRPLADGLELSADVDYDNTISLASLLHFGFYDAVFASWRNKPVKIISSMGKQSSGKSYLLNHLSGSLLDVSGGRCTDGVWMTVRISDEVEEKACMYVLLDFEGVGTFERSEQEDMLLSVLNAAISNITIYNKKDFNLDRETETVFERFQNGVSLVKADDKLFKGLFYIAVKDVGEEDVYDLHHELMSKIQKMLANSRENFLTKMYGGRVTLGLMASFDTANFYTSIDQIYDTIDDPELKASYVDGRSFYTDLRLLIAQLCAQDWASMDSKRMELRVYLIRAHLHSAVSMGRLDTRGNEVNLVNFDSQEEIEDDAIQMRDNVFAVNDTGLKLIPCDDDDSIADILRSLKEAFQDVVKRSGEDDESWHAAFIEFLEKLADRRRRRVVAWIFCNAQTFKQHDEIERIELEAIALCTEMKQKLSVCSCTCEECFLRCTKEKGHSLKHGCLGDHKCSQSCSYCVREKDNDDIAIKECSYRAGHQGSHDCKSKSHTCEENCLYHGIAANCNKNCAEMVGHTGRHICNSREHKCSETCSLGSCTNPCVTPFEVAEHFPHVCHEKFCPSPCSMKGCNRRCASQNHFHEDLPNVVHFCGLAHTCAEKCEAVGNCAVQQDLIKTTKTFKSKYGSFEYEHVAEQSGLRKPCCKEIPPFQTTHSGPHSHTLKENVVHLCDTKCGACGYFCTEPIGHVGLHNTVHGNMRDTKFAAEFEKIEIEDRVYAWGESGAAEMCNMHCKGQGRGHIHLVLCPAANSGGVCYRRLYADGVQHETKKYGPNFDIPKDEMTHAAYWSHMRFVDPCTDEDKASFNLCGHECESEQHKVEFSTLPEKGKSQKSFCTLQVCHAPVSEDGRNKFTRGYITRDGHHMDCKHELASNVVFVIDRSGSMSDDDITPQFAQFQKTHNNRLGCVFEAILRFVRTRRGVLLSDEADLASVVLFCSQDPAVSAVELEVMDESVVDRLLIHHPSGGTCFSTGLKQAQRILLKSKSNGDLRPPVLIFLSDGSNFGSDYTATMATIQEMRSELDNRLVIFTVKFGNDKDELLVKMADEGRAFVSMDLLMLSNTFVKIAKSLKPQTAALLVKGKEIYNPRPWKGNNKIRSFSTDAVQLPSMSSYHRDGVASLFDINPGGFKL